MGWLYNFSGLKEVATKLAEMREKVPMLKLLIVGEGDALPNLLKIRDNDLKNQIVLTGQQPYARIPELLSTADICLLPADSSEPTMRNIVPIKIYEYMAEGKPVIVTKLPGILKEFGNNNGIIYVDRPEDVIETAAIMIARGTIKCEGAKAKNFVKNNDWAKITDDFENLLQKIT
jgi:glycosyltransferase involved in cell wall biosynthesis